MLIFQCIVLSLILFRSLFKLIANVSILQTAEKSVVLSERSLKFIVK